MQKISRFLILAVIFSLSFVFLFSILPAIVWLFGGSFQAVAHSWPYVFFGGIIIIYSLGFLFADAFDSNFYDKTIKK